SGHSFAVLPRHRVNDVEFVVDLRRAEIQSRGLLAADGFVTFKPGRSKLGGHRLEAFHGFCDPRIFLGPGDTGHRGARRDKACSDDNADEMVPIHFASPCCSATDTSWFTKIHATLRTIANPRNKPAIEAPT